ncbi:anaerobic ribonucleoside triphosphate reductase [Clostridioides difficile]|nr:anaerobic ribonucleoside triphosphate reductase [Clostridioides difficile]
MKNVVKRDGRIVPFDEKKIINAIEKSFLSLRNKGKSEVFDRELATLIAKKIKNKPCEKMHIEDIQDIIEFSLMASKKKDVAKEYITYREKRNIARGRKTYNDYMSIVNTESNDITKENANMNADTPAGMMMKFASETTKTFTDHVLLSEEAKEAMMDNYIHIHDKDYYPTKSLTCIQHPLDKIFNNGFRAGHGSSRPTKRIETSSILGCISLETVQNEMHGGQAIPAFDFYNAQSVRKTFIEEIKNIEIKDDIDLSHLYNIEIEDYIIKDLKELDSEKRNVQHAINRTVWRVHQSMESFIHNMNTIHSRGGNQVVFSSINYGTDTSAEGRCIIREILKSTYEGVGNGETPIFPIQIWKVKEGVNYNPTDRNYDLYELACKVSAKRFFPNFLNLDATFNKHVKWKMCDPNRYIYEVATMGCRTRVFEDLHGEKTSIGRGNLSFTTLNLVRMALEAKEKYPNNEANRVAEFIFLLDKYSDVVARQLYDRYLFQCTAKAKQFPLLMSGLWKNSENLNPNDDVSEVLKHGTLGVGFIGLAECLIALIGEHHGESEKAQKLGLEIISLLKSKVEKYKKKYNLNYSVLGTPAEGLSGKFTQKDKKIFGEIKNITDKDYYTNSSHVPVWYNCNVEHKAKIEAPYHELEGGGHIFYVELDGDATHNPKAIMKVVDLMKKYNMGYGSVNHTRSRCMNCGFENADSELKECPKCGSNSINIIQRITGYLVGTTDSWNNAKLAELKDRVTHG